MDQSGIRLRCTVRNCTNKLEPTDGGVGCAAGHRFDRAKQGYISLLQPQDRKSKSPGDSDDAVIARHRWLSLGHHLGLVEKLQPWTQVHCGEESDSIIQTLELGCGEGTFGKALFENQAKGFCGIDLSRRALRLAARLWPEATWVLANADRTLPVFDQSVARVVSMFGRRPVSEIARVLTSKGICIVAIPGADDLIELREITQLAGHRRNRSDAVIDQMSDGGLSLVEQYNWHHKVRLDSDAIQDALAMTYRAVRKTQHDRIKSLDELLVTLSADLLLFRK